MKRAAIAATIVTFLAILSGCVTAPANPTGPSERLLVGQLVFNLSGFSSDVGTTVNGRQSQGVRIYLMNLTTGKVVKAETHGRNGLFFVADPGPDSYAVIRLYYKAVSGQDLAYINFPLYPPPHFSLTPTGVSDVGLIVAKNVYNGAQSVSSEKAYDQVRRDFSKMFPQSKWNSAKWSHVQVHTGE